MELSSLLSKMTVFIVLMLIGYFAARLNYVDENFTKTASTLTMNVFLVGTIFASVLSDVPQFTAAELGMIMLALTATIAIPYFVGFLSSFLLPGDKRRKHLVTMLVGSTNLMFISFPVVQSLYGASASIYVVMCLIPFNLFLYSLGPLCLRRQGEKISFKAFINVPMIASIISLIVFVTRPAVPQPIKEISSALSGATMPMSMLVIGTSLGKTNILKAFANWRVYAISLAKLIIAPIVTWLMIGLFIKNELLMKAIFVMVASPSAIVVTMLSIEYGNDTEFSSQSILVSTVLSMFTIPAMVYFLL